MSDALKALAAMQCRPGAPLLSKDQLEAHAAALPGWSHDGGRLRKSFAFGDFHAVMEFVNALAYIAHRQDHHPDLVLGYNKAEITYSTHDAGGITLNDCICAARIEMLDS